MNWFDNFGNLITNFFSRRGYTLSKSYLIGQKGAVWIPVDKPYELFNQIPQLNQVVSRKAAMFANMEIELVDENGEEIEDADFEKLIQHPNALQSMNEWLRQFKIQEQVYGNQFMYKNKPSQLSKYPVALWNISPRYIQPYLSGKVWEQTEVGQIISYYEYNEGGTMRKFTPEEIMYSRINDLDNPIIGTSPLCALQFPLTNTKLAYEYRNVIMGEKGAIGILSNQSKDAMGAVPLKPEERKKIENAYRTNFGIGEGQQRIHITEASLNWQPMTYPTKDLLLFEEVDANMLTIVDAFGMNINAFSSKNATFENVRQSIKQTYQDTIIPEADQFAQSLTKFLNLPNGQHIVCEYDHVGILQEDKSKEADVIAKNINSVNQLIQQGIVTREVGVTLLNELTGKQIEANLITNNVAENIDKLSPLVANNVLTKLTINEVRSLAGLPPIENGDSVATAQINPTRV